MNLWYVVGEQQTILTNSTLLDTILWLALCQDLPSFDLSGEPQSFGKIKQFSQTWHLPALMLSKGVSSKLVLASEVCQSHMLSVEIKW